MKIKPTNLIRQQEPGQFRRPVDGKKPYVYANDQKLESKAEQKKSVVYVDNKNIDSFEKGLKSNSPRLFDSNAGLKVSISKLSVPKKEEKADLQYDKTGKTIVKTTTSTGENTMTINQINSENFEAQNMYQAAESRNNEGVDKPERTDARQSQIEEVKTTTNGEDRVDISKEAQALAQQYYSKQENNVETENDSNQAQIEEAEISIVV